MRFRALVAAVLLLAPLTAAAQAQEPALESRVERLEAESAILKVLIEYGAYLDGRDYAAYAGLFAKDGVWVGGFGSFTGPQAIEAMLAANLGAPEPGFVNKANFHMMTNPIVTVADDGKSAEVTSKYLFWTRGGDYRPVPSLAGRYVDHFVLENGEWKIARRTTYGAIPYRDPANAAENVTPGLSLEARVQKVEDQLAIQRVIIDYGRFLDAQDFDAYAGLFATNGTWQNGKNVRTGAEEIKAMLVGLFGTPPPGFVNGESYHLISNIEIDVDGDHAIGWSRHLLLMRDEGGSPRPALAGWYEDEFIRVDGKWKILHRIDHPLMPTAEEWLKQMAARRPAQ